ncbi:MAG: sulfatase-like hydrolase/transferase, partial [Planctomycetes bacterium]|nr:sulfatase-like hydrolase/transferase [Planctomycetota bacterium]
MKRITKGNIGMARNEWTRRLLFSFIALIAAAAPASVGAQVAQTQAKESRPPNVVILFIDDLGYADIGPFGAKAYATPHLDRMAAEGRIFTDFHSATAV